jgi:hypothetical protein
MRSSDRLIGPFASSETQPRFQVWGYRLSLGYKIVVLSLFVQPPVPEHSIRAFCEKVRDAVFDRVMDPFYQPFAAMDSPGIIARISRDADAIPLPSA